MKEIKELQEVANIYLQKFSIERIINELQSSYVQGYYEGYKDGMEKAEEIYSITKK